MACENFANRKGFARKAHFLVSCYGSHDEFRLIFVNLQEYNPKTIDSSTPAVKKAIVELDNTLEIYETLSKTFLALKARDKLGCNSVSSSIAPIYDKLVATEAQLEKTRSDLLENIIHLYHIINSKISVTNLSYSDLINV